MTGDERPRRQCPVCGGSQLVSTLRGHVGGAACLVRLHQRPDGRPFDPVRGAVVLALSNELSRALNPS